MNTTMYNERFHRSLKYDYFHKSANSRADCLLQGLLDLVADLYRNHLTADTRN